METVRNAMVAAIHASTVQQIVVLLAKKGTLKLSQCLTNILYSVFAALMSIAYCNIILVIIFI